MALTRRIGFPVAVGNGAKGINAQGRTWLGPATEVKRRPEIQGLVARGVSASIYPTQSTFFPDKNRNRGRLGVLV